MRRRWAIVASVTVVAGTLVAFSLDELLRQDLPRGSRLWGVELSHATPARARAALEPRAQKLERGSVALELDGKSAVLSSFADAGLGIDWSRTLEGAIEARRRKNVASRFGLWLLICVGRHVELEPTVRVDAARLSVKLSELETAHIELPFAGGFKREAGAVLPDYPRPGRRLDRAGARRALEAALGAGQARARLSSVPAPAPHDRAVIDRLVGEAQALASEPVVLEDAALGRKLVFGREQLLSSLSVGAADDSGKLSLAFDGSALLASVADRAAVENEAKPARFEIDAKDRVQIAAGEPSRRLSGESLASAVMVATREGRRGLLPLTELEQPALTTEQARALNIRGLVSTFTTRHPCCERRVENIHRIADLLDGLLVKPGETVSVNAVVGPRTSKNGFVPAPTIEEGEMVETVGGGVSQFATTLFNALFHGGYEIIERQPHSYWFPRYPMGHEATLSYPKPDVIFRNDTDAGMLFDTRYTKTSITVRIFGDNGGRRVEAKVSPRKNVVEPPLEILPNKALPPDEEKVVQSGSIGWSVIVARIVHLPDGTKREEKRKVTYKPRARRVEVHPCRVPRGEPGHTGEPCPEPEASEATDEPSVPPG